MKHFLIFSFALMPSLVFAQNVDPSFLPPEWLASILIYLKTIPSIGPVLVEVFKWSGVIAAIMTALSAFFLALISSLKLVLNVSGLENLALKVDDFSKKILPILMYLSMFNVQKKD